ncbi:MAG: DUF374 domain-containing protein [Alphaproteobacteria bacterium]|nr:DUF374 domain-containing protein [Alphaproteobacteria bacterium]
MKLKEKWLHLWRDFMGTAIVQWPIAIFFAVLIWFVYVTCCTHVQNKHILKKYSKKPAIVVLWHGRSMMLAPVMKLYNMRTCSLASRNKDGRMMAKLLKLFGATKSIYGTDHDGGVSALRKGVRILQRGNRCIVMCPDGPSGPSMRIKDGVLYYAKMSGAPIIPVCFTCSKPWFQKRWDRYLVAKPFSKIIVNVGNPIPVPSKMTKQEFDALRVNIDNIMIKQLRTLDKTFNLFKVEENLTATEFKEHQRALRKQKKSK